jgi:hypothetical protein
VNSSIEAQLATAWDMATNQIATQAKKIETLQSNLQEQDGPRAKMARAKEAAEIQIGQNALAEVGEMLKAEAPDLDGISERLARVGALLDSLKPADDETAEAAPAVALESRR